MARWLSWLELRASPRAGVRPGLKFHSRLDLFLKMFCTFQRKMRCVQLRTCRKIFLHVYDYSICRVQEPFRAHNIVYQIIPWNVFNYFNVFRRRHTQAIISLSLSFIRGNVATKLKSTQLIHTYIPLPGYEHILASNYMMQLGNEFHLHIPALCIIITGCCSRCSRMKPLNLWWLVSAILQITWICAGEAERLHSLFA